VIKAERKRERKREREREREAGVAVGARLNQKQQRPGQTRIALATAQQAHGEWYETGDSDDAIA